MAKRIDFTNLSIEIKETANEVVYTFSGDVDENFRHLEVPRVSKPLVRFELAKINNFNSVGIREWIYLIKDFSTLGELVFSACSVTMIDQINMVPDSLGNGRIESFYAPYYCDCEEGGEVNCLIVLDDHQEDIAQKMAPTFDCPQCGNGLEFDALEESYFLFANNHNLPKVS